MKNLSVASLTIVLLFSLGSGNAQDTKKDDTMESCPMHKRHTAENSHHAAMEEHGDQAMGFSHDATTHHFRMSEAVKKPPSKLIDRRKKGGKLWA